ncbi:aspartate kinase [Sphingomonas sp. HT-1]|uniref:aspartate kinase n=1 Tax=unclassified Sphingomonas TaxID=196159 RepID=UPI0002FB4734|nr:MULTISPECIES: aspartate kinase [unclassified Sphingomonas]KTF70467.1 aspartate kinase [Sphingomonas sp. WG]
MARIVMKFGGTSMAGIERIRSVAARVKREWEAGNQVAVVVSAMAGETDRLVGFCREASSLYDPKEYDVVVSAGEQITSGLLAIALQAIGVPARSWLGWQLPVQTSDAFAKARIEDIGTDALLASMEGGEVAVVPGFQGVHEGRITTLGRGGSDTSAVAVAAAVKADRCDIYTDVDGVYTTDPRIVPRARKLKRVTYEEMLELASVGAKVLQTRSVGLAMKEGVRVQVLSSFTGDDAPMADTLPGTMIVGEEEIQDVERQLITGIAHDKNEAKITLTAVPDKPGAVASIFTPLADASINVDMIIQNIAHQSAGSASATDVTFTVPAADLARSIEILNQSRATIGFSDITHDTRVAKVSVVGVGMRSHAGVAATMFQTLGARGINIQAITTSEIKVSVLIEEDYTELAVRVLHTAYGLDADDVAA